MLATAVLVTDVATPEDAITVAGAITPEVLPRPVALGPVLPPVFTAPEPAPVPPVPTAAPLTTAAGAGGGAETAVLTLVPPLTTVTPLGIAPVVGLAEFVPIEVAPELVPTRPSGTAGTTPRAPQRGYTPNRRKPARDCYCRWPRQALADHDGSLATAESSMSPEGGVPTRHWTSGLLRLARADRAGIGFVSSPRVLLVVG